MEEKIILVSAQIIFKVHKSDSPAIKWFLVKQNEEIGWEIPKAVVRKGESSVRTAIRVMAEQGGMRAKVFEEVGRAGGATKVSGDLATQRTIYYLMMCRERGEALGYIESEWFDYGKAIKKLSSKRDTTMLSGAKKLLKEVVRERRIRKLKRV